MDSLTQLVLGAAVGYAVGGKNYGKKALYMGALAGTLPDLDSLVLKIKNDPFTSFVAHRGISHSLFFCVTAPFILAPLTQRLFKFVTTSRLYFLYFWVFLTHTLLDCFTSWGTQLFWPFFYRVALNSIFIIDPLYTLPLLVACVVVLRSSSTQRSQKAIRTALLLSSLYLAWTCMAKLYIDHQVQAFFKHNNMPIKALMTRPGPFNTFFWSVTAETESKFLFGQLSLLNTSNIELTSITKSPLPESWENVPQVKTLRKITKGFYNINSTSTQDVLIINDFRYGLMRFGKIKSSNPIFRYKLTQEEDGVGFEMLRTPVDSDED